MTPPDIIHQLRQVGEVYQSLLDAVETALIHNHVECKSCVAFLTAEAAKSSKALAAFPAIVQAVEAMSKPVSGEGADISDNERKNMDCQSSPSDESTRSAKLKWLTNSLPEFPHSEEKPWVWTEEETAILRAACAKRFDESLRTESLFCIAATGIRIYLSRDRETSTPAMTAGAEGRGDGRAAFEADCRTNDVHIGRHHKYSEQYQLYETQLRWMGWQAAWNARTPSPQPKAGQATRYMGDQSDVEALTDACNELLRNMKNLIAEIEWYRLNTPPVNNPHAVNMSQMQSYMALDNPKSLLNSLRKWREARGLIPKAGQAVDDEIIIELLRPYLHFGTRGWRRVAEAAVDAIRPYLAALSPDAAQEAVPDAEVVDDMLKGARLSLLDDSARRDMRAILDNLRQHFDVSIARKL